MITIDGKQIKLQIWDTVMYVRRLQSHGRPPEGGGLPLVAAVQKSAPALVPSPSFLPCRPHLDCHPRAAA